MKLCGKTKSTVVCGFHVDVVLPYPVRPRPLCATGISRPQTRPASGAGHPRENVRHNCARERYISAVICIHTCARGLNRKFCVLPNHSSTPSSRAAYERHSFFCARARSLSLSLCLCLSVSLSLSLSIAPSPFFILGSKHALHAAPAGTGMQDNLKL